MNSQLRVAEYQERGQEDEIDRAKSWISNTVEEPGLAREGSILADTGQKVQPEGQDMEGPLPAVGVSLDSVVAGSVGSWNGWTLNLQGLSVTNLFLG